MSQLHDAVAKDQEYFNLNIDSHSIDIVENIKNFSKSVLQKNAFSEIEKLQPKDAINYLNELDLQSLFFPENYDGVNADMRTVMLVLTELGYGDLDFGILYFTRVEGIMALQMTGLLEDLAESNVQDLRSGQTVLGLLDLWDCNQRIALSIEPLTISGQFDFCLVPQMATGFITLMKIIHFNNSLISLFWLNEKNKISFTKRKLIGINATDVLSGRVQVEDTAAVRLIEEKGPFQMAKLYCARTIMKCSLLYGALSSCYNYAFNYAKGRRAFGQSIIRHQAISMRLGTELSYLESARLLLWKAAASFDSGNYIIHEMDLLTSHFFTIAQDVTKQCVQIAAGHGYTESYPFAKWYRDCMALATLVANKSLLVR